MDSLIGGSMNNQQQEGVFINGKAQIVEMLQYMEPNERETLIKNLRLRNPALTQDLVRESMTFDVVEHLSDKDWMIVFQYIDSRILGIALKFSTQDFQRRLLGLAPRDYAEEAYSTLTTPVSNGRENCRRAQKKIMDMVLNLSKRRLISL